VSSEQSAAGGWKSILNRRLTFSYYARFCVYVSDKGSTQIDAPRENDLRIYYKMMSGEPFSKRFSSAKLKADRKFQPQAYVEYSED
jgi:hypothetical protein